MIGDLIGAGAKLLGGIFGSNATEKANEQAMALAREQNAQNQRNFETQIQLQKDFAQTGIQWKVQDAKAAGLHPLYAMGASGTSYAPVSVGSVTPSITPDMSMSAAVAGMGQDIGRAVNSTRSQSDRVDAFTKTVQGLSLEKMGLENQLLASQIAKNNAAPNPPMPIGDKFLIPGQGQTVTGPAIKDGPLKRVNADGSLPHQEPGAITDIGHARTEGGLYPVPSSDIKERIEDNLFHEAMHFMRNNLIPMFRGSHQGPYPAPAGKIWSFHPIYGYKLHDKSVGEEWGSRFN